MSNNKDKERLLQLEGSRFCSLPDNLVMFAANNAWRKRALRWSLLNPVPGMTEAQALAAYAQAYKNWAEVCGLDFSYTATAREADIRKEVGRIDGKGRTLAWSELANGSDQPLRQMYDSGEDWLGNDLLLITAAHEIGHALGIGHSNDSNALMYPSLNTKTKGKPQSWDVAEAVSRYGKPNLPPPVTPVMGTKFNYLWESRVIEGPADWTYRTIKEVT